MHLPLVAVLELGGGGEGGQADEEGSQGVPPRILDVSLQSITRFGNGFAYSPADSRLKAVGQHHTRTGMTACECRMHCGSNPCPRLAEAGLGPPGDGWDRLNKPFLPCHPSPLWVGIYIYIARRL